LQTPVWQVFAPVHVEHDSARVPHALLAFPDSHSPLALQQPRQVRELHVPLVPPPLHARTKSKEKPKMSNRMGGNATASAE